MHARATRCVATRGDAPTRGRSGGHAIRAHSISVSRKRKPAWRSSRRARRSHAARRPTHARTHARPFARSHPVYRRCVAIVCTRQPRNSASIYGAGHESRRVPTRCICTRYYLFSCWIAASYVIRLLRRRRPRRRRIARRRPARGPARHPASHPRGFARATPRRFAAPPVDAPPRRSRRRQPAADRRPLRHRALQRRVESH